MTPLLRYVIHAIKLAEYSRNYKNFNEEIIAGYDGPERYGFYCNDIMLVVESMDYEAYEDYRLDMDDFVASENGLSDETATILHNFSDGFRELTGITVMVEPPNGNTIFTLGDGTCIKIENVETGEMVTIHMERVGDDD